MSKKIVIIILFIFYSIQALYAEDFIIDGKNGSINWTKGFIIARGRAKIAVGKKGMPREYLSRSITSINRARLDAYRRAREDALEKLISAIKTIKIDSEKLFRDMLKEEPLSQKRISEAIMNTVRIREYPVDFYSSECEAKIKVGDIIASIPYDFPSRDFPERDDVPIETKYSSVIIDARNLNIKPMLFPSVYTEDGLEIYGRFYVNSRFASKRGMASYCYNEDEALRNYKAGTRPFYTVALKSINGCPVISEKASRKILSSKFTINNLKRCSVIIILDRG